ncbi:hypothetical protein GTP38_11140 [Duganella sp. FT94W]|uniref:Uncharacterized protein n=1 Tax=Duganella lactea TaxID=2692173 RepID=A0ABW9V5C3_9BURK|nr:hypothetical protein [Duganella lactea]MYM34894.1 hypothetical protein [Duganella lactea]
MLPKELKSQKLQEKRLAQIPAFKPMKKGKLPKPFNKMGGPRLSCTGLVNVSLSHQVIFVWKDGEIFSDRAFFGWLMKKVGSTDLYPLLEMHWHPSHKGLHIKTPCNTDFDYSNRQLPSAPELDIRAAKAYDPQLEDDRLRLVERFCQVAGIELGAPEGLWSLIKI